MKTAKLLNHTAQLSGVKIGRKLEIYVILALCRIDRTQAVLYTTVDNHKLIIDTAGTHHKINNSMASTSDITISTGTVLYSRTPCM